MNYFDKATNAMVPFHPQTESGAITDWHESIIGSLASKVLPTVVRADYGLCHGQADEDAAQCLRGEVQH